MLLTTMRHDLSKRFKDDLFESYGPLGSLSARIDFCYALRLIDKETRSDLRIIKEIRNELSHSPTLRHFNDREMDLIFRKFIQYKVGNDNMTLFGSKIVSVIKSLFDDEVQRKLVLKFLKDAKEWSEP
jgi:DNA-binding MltR family transcriptional regulator